MNNLNLKSLEPKIMRLPEVKLIAKGIMMSFAQEKTHELWKDFGPLIKEIPNKINNDKYSVQVYPHAEFFQNFDPKAEFNKYAAVSVSQYGKLPEGLEQLIIPEGLYAIFHYIGKPSEASETFKYILTEWLPRSQYNLDSRPHLAIMGEKYKGEEPDSEEELLIPII